VTADFVLKTGAVSILRIDYAPGEYRMLLQRGEAVPMGKDLRGTYAKVTFKEGVRAVMDKVVSNGIAHHISVVYGEFIKMFEIVGKLLGWKVIQ
jgi:L-fucose isomerase-like protein